MKIAIIGVGFVGGTVADFLEEHGHEIVRVDPKYYDITIPEATSDADCAIVCVDSPPRDDGSCDGSRVLHVYEAIERDIPIMVKSTVTPDIVVNWPERIVTNPEFLRESSAAEDFRNQHTFIIGAELAGKPAARFFQKLFEPLLPGCEFVIVNRSTASVIKYTHNAWLATKVAWFHELYSTLPDDVNYEKLTEILGKFPTIGNNHMKAPNYEGQLGYGGSCFPKDVSAFNHFIDHSILKQVEETNHNLKKEVILSDHAMKKLKKKIPDKPFAIFIGTSHTYGECNSEHQDYTFCNHVAAGLGLEFINAGSSGAFNLELLQIVNELESIGAFNENCKMVFLEPRLTDNTTVVQSENWLPWPVIADCISESNLANVPMLSRTRLGDKEVWFDNQIKHPLTLNDYLYIKIQADQTNSHALKKIASGYYGDDNLKNYTDEMILDKSVEMAEFNLALEKKNIYSAFADLVIIDSIKNMVKSKNIPFVWMLVDHREKFLKNLPNLYGGCSDIFDYMIFGDSAKEKMLQYLGLELIDDLRHLECECHHLNVEGNTILGEMILNELPEMIGDIGARTDN